MAGDLDVERFQRHAAERVLDDEAWRDGLDDHASATLLDAVLNALDGAVAAAAAELGDRSADDPAGSSETLDDLAYQAADQARALLETVGGYWRGHGHSLGEAVLAAEPALGPPLFASPEDGRQRLIELLAEAASSLDHEAIPPTEPEGAAPPTQRDASASLPRVEGRGVAPPTEEEGRGSAPQDEREAPAPERPA